MWSFWVLLTMALGTLQAEDEGEIAKESDEIKPSKVPVTTQCDTYFTSKQRVNPDASIFSTILNYSRVN